MFKSGQAQSIEDFKKKRQTYSQDLRKNNREERFSKRRNIIENDNTITMQNIKFNQERIKEKLLIVDERYQNEIQQFLRMNYTMENFQQLVRSMMDVDIIKQHYGLIGVRKILSIAENPPIQYVIDAGLVPRMIQYVKQQQYPQLQLEATWALTNVASGTTIQCQSIIDKGGIPLFVELLKSPNLGIVEQAIWAIGNIASDCVFYRDTIIRSGGLQNLSCVIERSSQQNIIKHGCWALSNLCRGSPLPKYENVKHCIPLLCSMVATGRLHDKQIVADCCWAISYHSDAQRNKIQTLLDYQIIPKVVNFIGDSYLSLVVPSIRIAGNVSTGSSQQTEVLLNCNILPMLQKAVDHHKKVVRREACWVISNIAAGIKSQVERLISQVELLQKILILFQTDATDVKRQICYIFSNLAHSGDPLVIFQLYQQFEIIKHYINLLGSEDAKTVEICLQCLYMILSVGEKFKDNKMNPLVIQLHSLGAAEILQKLQYHKVEAVYENVSKILVGYFQLQDPLDY